MRRLLTSGLIAGFLLAGSLCRAQTSTTGGIPTTQGRPTANPRPGIPGIEGSDADSPNPMAAMQQAQRVKAIANDRQKRIVDETARLLQLATELKEATEKLGKDQLTAESLRKLDEIEKLARDVKQRTKG